MSFSFDEKRDPRGPSEERSTRGDRRRQLLNDLLHQFDDQYHSMFSGGNYFKKGFPFDDDDDVEFGGLAERLLGRKRTAPPHAPVPAQPPPNLAREQQRMQEDSRGRRPQQNNHLPQHGLRNTVDIGAAAAAAGASGNQDSDRGQRSWSAPPPDNRQQPPTQEEMQTQQRQPPQSQRFVSRLNIPMNTSQKPAEYSTEQTQPKPQVQQQPQQNTNVRHIPIFVEGRDQPVYPKDNNNKSSAKPPRPQSKQQQQQHQQPQQQQQQPSPPVQEPSPSPPPPPPVNPVQQKLEHIMDELNRLANEIKALPWPSLRGDKAYIYIDEMLTRCLIQLDCLETGGDDNLRLARRELVRRTQCCITELEARLEPPPPELTAVLVGPIAEPQVQLKRPKKSDEPMDTIEENKAVLLGPVSQPKPQIQRPKNGKTDDLSNEMTAVLMGPVAEPQPQVIRPKNKVESEAKTEAEKNESQQSVSQATVKS